MSSEVSVFVSRVIELSALVAALADARDGKAELCHLHGASGSGKSTVLERFVRQASAEGALVLVSRCSERESRAHLAIDALIETLTGFLLELPQDDLQAVVPNTVAALAHMFTVLDSVEHVRRVSAASPAPIDPLECRTHAFSALRELVRGLSLRQPVVVVIDDLHWCDPDSWALLAALIAGDDPPPLMLLLAYRSEHLERAEFLRAVSALPGPGSRVVRRELRLNPLTEPELRTLAKALLKGVPDAESLAERIVAGAQGSAHVVHELARHALAEHAHGKQSGTDLYERVWRRLLAQPEDAGRPEGSGEERRNG